MGNIRSIPVLTKHNVSDICTMNGTLAISTMEGWRDTMEDTHIMFNMENFLVVGIFDGHGNDICSKFCKETFESVFCEEYKKMHVNGVEELKLILIETFKSIDNNFKTIALNEIEKNKNTTLYECGTTALVAIITNSHYIIANCGDSRAIVINKSSKRVELSTIDHKPTVKTETERIISSGHFVESKRVDKKLAVSRAIGDYQYKENSTPIEKCAVTCIPDIFVIEKSFNTLLMMACDGIWDVISNDDAMNFILKVKQHNFTKRVEFENGSRYTIDKYYESEQESSLKSTTDSNHIEQLCNNLINIAFDRGSTDNFSVAIYNC